MDITLQNEIFEKSQEYWINWNYNSKYYKGCEEWLDCIDEDRNENNNFYISQIDIKLNNTQ